MTAALIVALAGCDKTDSLNPDSSTEPEVLDPTSPMDDPIGIVIEEDTPVTDDNAESQFAGVTDPSLASISYAGGIPMGAFALPNTWFGDRYNGAMRTIWPEFLVSNLSAIKARGGKVVLNLAGADHYYKDGSGNFSLTKWKARVDRFRKVNINSYISDGTIIGHYMIDEPHDPSNWNGRTVPGSTLDEMARYSKSIWPSMPTIVRGWPDFLDSWSYRYLDAAWAQYSWRFGNVSNFIDMNVSKARNKGLALIVGLNMIKGGNPKGTNMTASEVKSWGSTLLSSSYPCAFISWQYNSSYLSSSSMKDAMNTLRNKAENRSFKSCRGS